MDLISAAAFVRGLDLDLVNRVIVPEPESVIYMGDTPYTVHNVWYEGVYGNGSGFTLVREYWYGVWRNDKTGTYAAAPKVDKLGRLNGSL